MVAYFKKQKKSQDKLFAFLLIFLFFGIIGFLIYSNWKINSKRAEQLSRIEELKKEILIMEEKNAQLKAGIEDTSKDSYWEGKAREQGYKKPGEEQVVILPPQEGEILETSTQKNLWQKILEKLNL